jgi:hypothetical protein
MTRQETAWEAAEAAAMALGPEAGEFAALDAAGFGRSTRDVLMRGVQHPGDLASAVLGSRPAWRGKHCEERP